MPKPIRLNDENAAPLMLTRVNPSGYGKLVLFKGWTRTEKHRVELLQGLDKRGLADRPKRTGKYNVSTIRTCTNGVTWRKTILQRSRNSEESQHATIKPIQVMQPTGT